MNFMKRRLEKVRDWYDRTDFVEKFFDESDGRTAWATHILHFVTIAVSILAILLTISKQ